MATETTNENRIHVDVLAHGRNGDRDQYHNDAEIPVTTVQLEDGQRMFAHGQRMFAPLFQAVYVRVNNFSDAGG